MKIASIKLHNLLGQSATHRIAPITVITGENSAGKTAILRAIKVASVGYDPKLGKSAAATAKLATGPDMGAAMEFDNGQTNYVNLTKKGNSNKVVESLPVKLPAVLLDINDFLSRTASERRKFLFTLAATDIKFVFDELVADVKNVKVKKATKESEAVITELVEFIQQLDQDREQQGIALDEWFADTIKKFETKASEARGAVKMMRESVKADAALAAQNGIEVGTPDDGQSIVALETVIEKITAARKTITDKLDEVNKANSAFETTKNELDGIATEFPEHKRLTALVAEKQPEVDKLGSKVSDVEQKLRRDKLRPLVQGRTNLLTAKATTEEKINGLTILNSHKCAHCGSDKAHWTPEVIAARAGDLDTARTKLSGINTELEQLVLTITELETAIASSDVDKNLFDAANTELNTIKQQLATEDSKLNSAMTLKQSAQARLDAMKEQPTDEELIALFNELHAQFLSGPQESTDQQLAALDSVKQTTMETVKQMREKRDGQIMAQESKRAREERKEQMENAVIRDEVVGLVCEKLTERQVSIIDAGIQSFMDRAGDLVEAVLGFKLEFKDGEVGYWKGAQWVSYATFGGTEEALAFAGLSLVFAQDSPCRFIIIDELARLTPASKFKLFKRLASMIEKGLLDNFITVDVEAAHYATRGCIPMDIYSNSALYEVINIEDKKK